MELYSTTVLKMAVKGGYGRIFISSGSVVKDHGPQTTDWYILHHRLLTADC